MPQLGLEVTEGLVVEILVEPGATVSEGDPILVLSTDKADAEVEAPTGGVIREIAVSLEETVPIGAVLMLIADTADEPLDSAPPATRGDGAAAEAPTESKVRPEEPVIDAATPRRRVAPIARRAAARLDLDLDRVQGTGPNGRITLGDVEAAAEKVSTESAPPTAPAAPGPDSAAASPMRRAVARRMSLSQREIPQYQLVREVDATHLLAQKRAASAAASAEEVKPGFNDLLVQAMALMVQRHPALATIYEEGEGASAVLRHMSSDDIGLAVATDAGLTVPVIRAAGTASLREIAARRADLVGRARAGRLDLREISGGVISLSNLGGFGIDRFTAMVNPGEASILAVGRTVERLVPRGRGSAVVPVLTVTLSCDHRSIDGAAGAAALAELAELLEGGMPWRN